MEKRVILAILLSFLVLGTGCLGNRAAGHSSGPALPESSGNEYPASPQIPVLGIGSSPTVTIIDPPFDGGIPAGNITIFVRVTNFDLAPHGTGNPAGTGHLIYYRDVVPPATDGIPAVTLPGTYAVSQTTSYQWDGVSPGTHTFAVQLVNNDNTPLDPPVLDAVDITAVLPGMIRTPDR